MAFVINQTNCSGAGGCGTVTVTSVGTAYTFTVDLTAAPRIALYSVGGTPRHRRGLCLDVKRMLRPRAAPALLLAIKEITVTAP